MSNKANVVLNFLFEHQHDMVLNMFTNQMRVHDAIFKIKTRANEIQIQNAKLANTLQTPMRYLPAHHIIGLHNGSLYVCVRVTSY